MNYVFSQLGDREHIVGADISKRWCLDVADVHLNYKTFPGSTKVSKLEGQSKQMTFLGFIQ